MHLEVEFKLSISASADYYVVYTKVSNSHSYKLNKSFDTAIINATTNGKASLELTLDDKKIPISIDMLLRYKFIDLHSGTLARSSSSINSLYLIFQCNAESEHQGSVSVEIKNSVVGVIQ